MFFAESLALLICHLPLIATTIDMADPTLDASTVSGFYGPGAFAAWLLTAAATTYTEMARNIIAAHKPSAPPWGTPGSAVFTALFAYAAVAAGDVMLRMVRGAAVDDDAQLAAALAVCRWAVSLSAAVVVQPHGSSPTWAAGILHFPRDGDGEDMLRPVWPASWRWAALTWTGGAVVLVADLTQWLRGPGLEACPMQLHSITPPTGVMRPWAVLTAMWAAMLPGRPFLLTIGFWLGNVVSLVFGGLADFRSRPRWQDVDCDAWASKWKHVPVTLVWPQSAARLSDLDQAAALSAAVGGLAVSAARKVPLRGWRAVVVNMRRWYRGQTRSHQAQDVEDLQLVEDVQLLSPATPRPAGYGTWTRPHDETSQSCMI